MADETDRFLHSLYEQAKQDGEDPEEVAERIYQNARGVSRRELLAGGGALGLGAAMGGGGAYAATGQASADASTSDSDGNVGTPSDRVDVFGDGVDTLTSSLTDRNVVYVYGVDENQSAAYRAAYDISDHSDIGAAIQAANDDAIAAGIQGVRVVLPHGVHQYSAVPVVDCTNIEIIGKGIPTYHGGLRHGTILQYTGTATDAFVVRGTGDSPNTDRVDYVRFARLGFEPDGDDDETNGLLIDGTTDVNANGSTVRGVEFERTRFQRWSGSACRLKGTVFDQTFTECYFRGDPGLHILRDGATSGVSSQTDVFGGWWAGTDSGYAADMDTGSLHWYGGSITTTGGNGDADGVIVRKCNGGGISGTHVESVEGTGITVETVTGGPFDVYPSRVFSCGIAVNVGNGTTDDTVRTRHDYQTNNNATDLHVTAGGDRNPVVVENGGIGVQNDRLSTDGKQDVRYPERAVVKPFARTRVFHDWGQQQIGDTATERVADEANSFHGLLFVSDTSADHSALVGCVDENGPSIIWQDASHFTTTAGNSGTINVIRDSGVYKIENQVGSAEQINWSVQVTSNAVY